MIKHCCYMIIAVLCITACMNQEKYYQLPDSDIYFKVIDGGRWTVPYNEAATVCFYEGIDSDMYSDTLFVWKGVDWNWPLIVMVNPSKTDTVFFEAPLGALGTSHFRTICLVYRFRGIPDKTFINEDNLLRKDTVFFKTVDYNQFIIKDPFVAIYFSEKFDEVYYEKNELNGKRIHLKPYKTNNKTYSLRAKKRLFPQELIKRIDYFYQKKSRLPDSLDELSIGKYVNIGLYYRKIDSSTYTISIDIGCNEKYVYYSNLKQWIIESITDQ